jgi:flagellar basal body-associated protein FliL
MSEQTSEKKSEKKVVGRTVAIALGIICIILVVGLSGAILQIFSLNSQVSDLTDTLNLGKSAVLVNNVTFDVPPSSYQELTYPQVFMEPAPAQEITINHAGYISVTIQSTTNDTYVRVIYSYQGTDNQTLNYDNQMSVRTGEISVFPILPTSFLEVRVINNNTDIEAKETVTITYYY